MKNTMLYIITVAIWGSTWLAIKQQLGTVDPMVSVVYRFCLASVLLLGFCKARGLSLVFSLKNHLFLMLLGGFLFSFNYWLVYVAESRLTSGLVAVVFSLIVFANIINAAIFLKAPLEKKMLLGAFLGMTGIGLIFMPEIQAFSLTDKSMAGAAIGLASVLLASLGNIVSARNTRHQIPIIQANAVGMAYGTIFLGFMALLSGREFSFVVSASYIGSLFYLAIFGSVIAFYCYLTLVGSIGAGRASYAIMLVPVVALGLSSFFEGYEWSLWAGAGLLMVLSGNLLVLGRSERRPS